MASYVLVNRRAGKFTSEAKLASRAAVATTLAQLGGDSRIIADKDPRDELARRVVVFDASSAEIAKLLATLSPDAFLEPLVRRSLHKRIVPIELTPVLPMDTVTADAAGPASTYRVTVKGGGKPLAGIDVMFYVRDPGGHVRVSTVKSDKQGRAKLTLATGYLVAFVEPIPYSGYWITLAEAPASGSSIDCIPIAKAPADGSGWWHRAMGIEASAGGRGATIKVGVIDTGCGPHPNLAQVKLVGAYVDGKTLPGSQATDVAEHGTHTSGIIGARPQKSGDYQGMAPACELYHARVFKSEEEGPSQADLINAIDALSRGVGCDLINMSLGGGPPSPAEEDAIRDAAERGTLCICSAGNEAAAIDYPGAYPECAAVSAIGEVGWAPAGTFSAGNRPRNPAMMGQKNLFLAAFSCYGPTLACAGPGIGIVSTVPNRTGVHGAYMEMDGTSMASPAVCGTLAVILAQDAAYKALPRDLSRSNAARNALAQHCVPFGLPVKYEGRGLPQV
jgi:subtilisin family serine protease